MRKRIGVLAMASVFVGAAAFAAAPAHCVREGANATIEWNAAGSAESAKVFFHTPNAKFEHYVDMQRSGDRFWAVLPKPADETSSFEYRVVSYAGKKATERDRGTYSVTNTCSVASLGMAEAAAASRIVVGRTSDTTATPIGFRCDGIVGTLDASGALRAASCTPAAVSVASSTPQPVPMIATNGEPTSSPDTAPAASPASAFGAVSNGVVVSDAIPNRRHAQPRPNPPKHRRPPSSQSNP